MPNGGTLGGLTYDIRIYVYATIYIYIEEILHIQNYVYHIAYVIYYLIDVPETRRLGPRSNLSSSGSFSRE